MNHSRVAICAIMKDEAPYILEWVAYHRLLGFDLIVADNGGSDGTSDLLQRLDAVGALRRVDYTWATGQMQLAAYRAMFRLARAVGYEFAGFLDADEFFTRDFPVQDATPANGAAFISNEFDRLDASQLSYHWLCYGSHEAEQRTSDLVLARFTRHADPKHRGNRFLKSFVRVREMFGLRSLLCLGPPVLAPHYFPAIRRWFIDGKLCLRSTQTASYSSARILHYQVKSRAEFQARSARGDSMGQPNKYTAQYFQERDHSVPGPTIGEAALSKVADEMSRLALAIASAAPHTSVEATAARRLSFGVNLRPKVMRRLFRAVSLIID